MAKGAEAVAVAVAVAEMADMEVVGRRPCKEALAWVAMMEMKEACMVHTCTARMPACMQRMGGVA